MTDNSNGVVILITLLNILVYKLQKLQQVQKIKRLPFSARQIRQFSFRDIQLATNNFQDELVIGKGGFGMVYKGIIDFKERIVAIKRLKSMSKQGSKEFQTEIDMLSQFQHSNLVPLIGYCDESEEMILVYEYMPCGNLADHLHKRVRKGDAFLPCLSWVQRLKICVGAAHGLDYLHTGTGVNNRVIHRDVKTTNILLDGNLAAKISDFGLSKTGPANKTCTYVSTRVKGTPGYIDPYYISTHRLTRKSDVYAFGVVLFEVLCGRPAIDKRLDEEEINLAVWAQHCFKEGLLDQLTDLSIKGDISSDSLQVYVDIAIKCLHGQPKHRPTMAEVVVSLESALTLQEKSTRYSLVEIMPTRGSPHKNQSSSRMTYAKRVSSLLSHAARAFLAKPKLEVLRTSNLRSFSFNDLSVATRKFHPKKKLRQDAFGCFYKGWVYENTFALAKWGTGLVVEVKKFNENFDCHEAEINCLGKLRHPNIVKLIGYCLKTDHRLLVYEFMPQGSLDQHLFRRNPSFAPLSWKLRMSIALGAAKGLAYLHSTEINVIHRDIQTAYILIDSKYNAKLSGFGLAKDGPEHGQDHVYTDVVRATSGSAAPEYVTTGHVSKKIDVYSFGVVLLEILTGKSVSSLWAKLCIDVDFTSEESTREYEPFSSAKGYLASESRICFVMDADMLGQYTVTAALKASSLALKCLSLDPKSRPDANQIVEELEQLLDLIISENVINEAQ